MSAKKTITILGSTGSIGKNTVTLVSANKQLFNVRALTAHTNVELLAEQARMLDADYAVIIDESRYEELKILLQDTKTEALAGNAALLQTAAISVDIVMSAIVGAAGLLPTMAAINKGTKIALANKECLVCAGELLTNKIKEKEATLIPVDSEHSAIFQVFDQSNPKNIEKIILTASGGPFRDFSYQQMKQVTPKQAISHPNWSMGDKISVDSATMVNKGLELIEAYYLFPVSLQQIEVIIHPESVVHSLVEYIDGSVLAQLGTPDMKTPISYALAWPERMPSLHQKLSLTDVGSLTFEPIDSKKFPAVDLARKVLNQGSSAPIVFNTANEIAVSLFMKQQISYLDIVPLIEEQLSIHAGKTVGSIEEVIDIIELVKQHMEEKNNVEKIAA